MKKYILIIAAVTCLLAGCSKPTMDTRSKDTFRESGEKVKKSLPVESHDLFEARLNYFVEKHPNNFKEHLEGKNGEQVLAYSERIIELKMIADVAMMHLLEQGGKSVAFEALNKKQLVGLKFADQYAGLVLKLGDSSVSYIDSIDGSTYAIKYNFSLNSE